MEYHLHYAEEPEMRRQLGRAMKRAQRSKMVLHLVVFGVLVAVLLWAVLHTAALLWVAVYSSVLGFELIVLLMFRLERRDALDRWMMPAGAELVVTTSESGLMTQLREVGLRTFRPWSVLRLLPLRAGEEQMVLSDMSSGGWLMLSLHGLSAEEREALCADVQAHLAAAKAGLSVPPLPAPEGFGEGVVGLSPAAMQEGLDATVGVTSARRMAWRMALTLVAFAALWGVRLWIPETYEELGFDGDIFLCVMSLWVLVFMGRNLLHPGRKARRLVQRFLKGNTYAFNADGTALLRRSPVGSWAVYPLSWTEGLLTGAHCRVMLLPKQNAVILPREPELPAALPTAALLRYRMPWWGRVFLLLMALSAAVSGYAWYTADSTEEQVARWMEYAEEVREAEEQRADAATQAEADAALQALMAVWVQYCRDEDAWVDMDEMMRQWLSLAARLEVWEERFPSSYSAALLLLPEPYRDRLQQWREGTEDDGAPDEAESAD